MMQTEQSYKMLCYTALMQASNSTLTELQIQGMITYIKEYQKFLQKTDGQAGEEGGHPVNPVTL